MATVQVCIFNPVTTLIDTITAAAFGPSAAGVPVVTNSLGVIDSSLIGIGVTATAGQNLTSGQLVNLYSNAGTLTAQIASAQNTGTAPSGAPYPIQAQGYAGLSTFGATQTFTGAKLTVNFFGTFTYIDGNAEFNAGTIGQEVFLSAITPGGVTLTPVTALEQAVGYVVGFAAPNIVSISFASGFQDFSHISGVNPITKGGTGATTAVQALDNLFGTFSAGQFWAGPLPDVGGGPFGVGAFGAGPFGSPASAFPTARLIFNTDLQDAIFGASGPLHNPGAVPDPGPIAGTTHFLREDGTWATIPPPPPPPMPIQSDHPGLTASFGPVTLLVPAATGMFRISVYEECTVAGASGGGTPFGGGIFGGGVFNGLDDNLQTVVTWIDDVGVRTDTPMAIPLDLGNTNSTSGDLFFRAVGGTPITFQTFLLKTGTPTYGVFVRLESL
jgi:hypothetical protein